VGGLLAAWLGYFGVVLGVDHSVASGADPGCEGDDKRDCGCYEESAAIGVAKNVDGAASTNDNEMNKTNRLQRCAMGEGNCMANLQMTQQELAVPARHATTQRAREAYAGDRKAS
jgi:hypothetical protein